jgi:hypothetical protein
MAVQNIYAGNTANTVAILPSPTNIVRTDEIIWASGTGRNASGKMVGDLKARKRTYEVQWGVLTSDEMNTLRSSLRHTTAKVKKSGYFYFAVASNLEDAKATAVNVYRSEIKADMFTSGSDTYYKDVSVSLIQV